MEKTIERIRKLLALAGNNPSEAEREAALGKAHALLIEHNLQMHDVAETVETCDAFSSKFSFRPSPWIRTITNAIAELYFCKFVFTRYGASSEFKATFVGMRVDADVASMVAESLLKSVKSQGARVAKSTGGSEASFKNAAAMQIYRRCRALMEEAQNQQKTPGTALVVQSLYKTRLDEAQAWMNNNMKDLKTSKSRLRLRNDEAARAGDKFGASLPLTALVKR